MTGGDLLIVVLGLLFIFIISHLSVDKDFDQNTRTGAYATMGILGVLYILFGVIF